MLIVFVIEIEIENVIAVENILRPWKTLQ